MRVILAGGLRQNGEHSMVGFVERLAPALQAEGVEAEIVHARPPAWVAQIQSKAFRKYATYLETYLRYPKRLRRLARKADVVHVTDQGLAHLLRDLPGASVATVHDLLAVRAALGEFDYWTIGPSGQAQQRIIRESLARATAAACVSTKTQDDLARLVPGLSSRVILNALYSDYRGERTEPDAPFFFCIGGNQPYKNRAGIVRVAGKVLQRPGFENHRFKLVGRWPDEDLDKAIKESGIAARIDLEIDASHEKVGQIYRSADGLFFLSREEGFGLPILEAQSAGCWVATTSREPMREVAGDGATMVPEAGADEEIAAAHAGRAHVVERGFHNLERFSVPGMAREYKTLYQEVAG